MCNSDSLQLPICVNMQYVWVTGDTGESVENIETLELLSAKGVKKTLGNFCFQMHNRDFPIAILTLKQVTVVPQ